MTERIILGSGHVYIKEFQTTLPEDLKTIAVEANLLGYIQGGASVEYKPEYYTAEDDSGKVSKTKLTKEEVLLKSAIMTLSGKTFTHLCPTARVTEASGKRIVKIGGLDNDDGKSYVILFVHTDKADGDIYVAIVGKNEAGFTLAFAKDKETVVDVEFKALPHDSEGTKIHFEEVIPSETPSGQQSEQPSGGDTV